MYLLISPSGEMKKCWTKMKGERKSWKLKQKKNWRKKKEKKILKWSIKKMPIKNGEKVGWLGFMAYQPLQVIWYKILFIHMH